MDIAVLGTGGVGRALAARLHELGHTVRIGTRDPAESRSRTENDAMGNPPVSAWLADHPDIALLRFADAAQDADLVVNATSGHGAVAAVTAAAPRDGTVVLDVSNPLDFSRGFPPQLFVKDTDSLAERIQRAVPGARVVKSLNTMNASVMVHPEQVGGGDHTVLVSGDDAVAKHTVTELLEAFGHRDVLDLGDLSTARGAEMAVALWVRLMGALGTPQFQLKVVR